MSRAGSDRPDPPLLELGGGGTSLLHFACANGFPPEAYAPLIAPFLARYRVVAVPPRALWPGVGAPPTAAGSWWQWAEDLLAGLDHHRLGPLVGVGHSFGAVATMLAATREPTRFRALVMLDPTILPPRAMATLAAARAQGEEPRFGLAEGALKRRARFVSTEEAFDYWRRRPLFSDWPDRTLRQYVAATLRPATDGRGYELRWAPAWEAWYYRSFHPASWDDLARLDPRIPVLVVRGSASDTFLPEAEEAFRTRRPRTSFAVIEDHGHLFPLSAPERTAGVLQQWLDRIGSGIT